MVTIFFMAVMYCSVQKNTHRGLKATNNLVFDLIQFNLNSQIAIIIITDYSYGIYSMTYSLYLQSNQSKII